MGVILCGPGSDDQIAAIERELDRMGVETCLWDADDWPGDGAISVRQSGTESTVSVGEHDPTDYHTVYLRSLALDPRTPKYEDRFEERPLAVFNQVREYQGLLESTLRTLADEGVRMVNPLDTQNLHRRKPWQLSTLGRAGVPVPETLTTNDPDPVREFVTRLDEVVYKPVTGGGHADVLRKADLTDERLSLLANSPVQFQERVDGDDLRIFVVDGEVVAVGRIHSDELDYRTAEHDVEAVDPAALDDGIASAAVRTAELLGLSFTGVDVIDGDGRFAVLEANPSPMFEAFDELAGTDVAGALAALLASPDRR